MLSKLCPAKTDLFLVPASPACARPRLCTPAPARHLALEFPCTTFDRPIDGLNRYIRPSHPVRMLRTALDSPSAVQVGADERIRRSRLYTFE